MQFVKPLPFQEAVDKLGSKSIIASKLNSEEWAGVPVALRERAFFSSTVESSRFLQRSRDAVADFLQSTREEIVTPNGTKTTALKVGSRAAFIKQMQDFAYAEGLGPIDPIDEGTIKDIRSEKRLGLIFDTQVRQAQDYGWWKQGQDPDVLDAFPAQRFIRERQVKEPRDFHRFHEGEVHLKSDLGFWTTLNQDFGVPWGPWGWGCGHDVEDVDREEAERLGLLQPGQPAKPIEKDFNDRLEASTRGLDQDTLDKLKNSFGDQVVVEGDSVRWNSDKPKKPKVAPAPVKPAQTTERQSPVSKKVSVHVTGTAADQVQQVLQQIDEVHDDGQLKPLPITHQVAAGSQGTYYRGAVRIGIKRNKPAHREMTIAHEVGHWIDEYGLPGAGMSSESHPDLQGWRDAVKQSQAYQNLKTKPGYKDNPSYRHYQLTWVELWARSYAQFIGTRSKDKTIGNQVKEVADGKTKYWVDSQWSDDDFAPIALAIEAVFRNMGWI